jgi:hypothetical protein
MKWKTSLFEANLLWGIIPLSVKTVLKNLLISVLTFAVPVNYGAVLTECPLKRAYT